MSSASKLKLLLWKNFLLQRRHKWQTFFEIASPVIFSLFLILLRCLVEPKLRPAMTYPPFQPTHFNLTHPNLVNLTSGVKKEGTVAFSPENPLTRLATKNAMSTVVFDNLGLLSLLFDKTMLPEPRGYNSAAEMEHALTQPNAMDKVLVGIQFDDSMMNATSWPENIRVALRFPAVMRAPLLEHPLRASWRTNLRFPLFPMQGPREPEDMYGGKAPGYSPELFLAVQHAVSQEIIKQKSGREPATKVYLRRFPQPPFREDKLLLALERFISMIIMLCFAYTFVNTVRMVTAEKELQLKETMAIMGLPSWLHWLAWFIKQFSFLLISVALMIILFKIPFASTPEGWRYGVLTYTPWHVLLFFMLLFVAASLTFSFMVSVFFTRANTAAAFMGLAWFSTYSVYMLTQVLYEDISVGTKMLLSLVSNAALGYAFQMIIACEGSAQGLQWDAFFKPVSYHDHFMPGQVALILVFDTVLYMCVAMYVERIRPGQYGVPLPWYFPFTKSFWFPNKDRQPGVTGKGSHDLEYADALLNVVHDEEPEDAKVGIDIQNLTKIYRGKKKAVDNLNLRFYENEITVLLGHNGAGKTTTISMLTGIIPATSGRALVNGYDISRETAQARRSLGLCPQHNVLFPDLTVAEHILFYSRLKGVPHSKLRQEVDHYVKLLNLESKRSCRAGSLSGGQQRRLAVCAALCGAARAVLLDEPSAGLDPRARRQLWDLLQREKTGRTIILTTHQMDEAEVLGDRVAIMARGSLQCCGSPLFLQRHYGAGYKLALARGPGCDAQHVLQFVKTYVPDATENTNIGAELTILLPHEATSSFPELLRELEARQASLKLHGFGLALTSLEEVFMRVGAESEASEEEKAPNTHYSGVAYNGHGAVHPLQYDLHDMNEMEKVRGAKLIYNQTKATFLKLALVTMRSKLALFIQLITPIINISISVLIARSWKFISQLPPMDLSLTSGYDATETLLTQAGNLPAAGEEESILNALKDYFKTTSYPGMKLRDLGTSDMKTMYLKLMMSEPGRVRYEEVAGASLETGSITAWFGNYGYHDAAVALALADGALLRALTSPTTSTATPATLTVTNHPLPYSIDKLIRVMTSGSTMGFQFAFNFGFCMAFVTAFIVLSVIKERVSGAALLGRAHGLGAGGGRGAGAGAALLWEAGRLQLAHAAAAAALAVAAEPTLATASEIGRVFLVLTVFSYASVPLHFLASFFFDAPATGFAKMCFLNIFLGCMPFLIVEVLLLPEVGSPFYASLFDAIFSPLPIYCISRSFRELSLTSLKISACEALCSRLGAADCSRHTLCHALNETLCCIRDDPYLEWAEPGVGRYLFMMFLVGTISIVVLLLKEYGFFRRVALWRRGLRGGAKARRGEDGAEAGVRADAGAGAEDADVSSERAAVAALSGPQRAALGLLVEDLSVHYGTHCAVDNLTFAVPGGTCVGLLGTNGAGKTSTFRVLSGAGLPSAGDAYVCGHSVTTDLSGVYSNIGYCPQFEALLERLTARETLRLFALYGGLPPRPAAAAAARLARALGFHQHYDKQVRECSGGTQRKLSLAVALLARPHLLLLDEPTTGMDPAAKRRAWSVLRGATGAGQGALRGAATGAGQGAGRGAGVLLASHSMEECAALCSRLALLQEGRLVCIGPLTHLQNKFSQGYTVVVKSKLHPDLEANVAQLHDYIMNAFPGAQLVERYVSQSTYRVGRGAACWRVFAALERARDVTPLRDYSVHHTTLEQIFMHLATPTAPAAQH